MVYLTNDTTSKLLGHAFYPSPLQFKNCRVSKNKSDVVSFSTNFVFFIVPRYPDLGGHGLAFVLASTNEIKGCLPNQYLGLPNVTQIATSILAVMFDTVQNFDLQDINDIM